MGGVEWPRWVVRFARLFHRRGGGNLSPTWLPRTVAGRLA
jgi:hypothetical protein